MFILEKTKKKDGDLEDNENSPAFRRGLTKKAESKVLKTFKTLKSKVTDTVDEGADPDSIEKVPVEIEEDEEESDWSANFGTEEEKNDDMPAIKMFKQETQMHDTENKETGFETLASPKAHLLALASPKQDHPPATTMRSTTNISFNELIVAKERRLSLKRRLSSMARIFSFPDPKLKDKDKLNDVADQLHSTGATSNKRDEKRIYTSLRNSLDVKHYSTTTKAFAWVCYILTTIFVATQIATSIDSISQFEELSWTRDVLVNAELRLDLITRLQRRFRVLSVFPLGFVSEAQMNLQVPNFVGLFVGLAKTELAQLRQANENLLIDSSSLKAAERKSLFVDNVKVFTSGGPVKKDTDTYDRLTTFQATNRLLGLITQALALTNQNKTAALPVYDLISRNCLDDMMIVGKENIVTVSTLLDTSHKELLAQTMGVIAAMAFLFGLLFIGGLALLMRLYKREVEILSTLTKIDETSVKQLEKDMIKFKTNVSEEYYYEEANVYFMSEHCLQLVSLEKTYQRKRKQEKVIKSSAIMSRYGKNFIKVVLCNLYLILFITVDRVLLLKTANKLYSYVKKIQFIKEVQEDTSLVSTGITEILINNSTTTIMNQPAEDFYRAQLLVLKNLKTQVPITLQNDDTSLDPYIEQALSGNGCALLTGTLLTTCTRLSRGSQSNGLLEFMSSIESAITMTVDSFLGSNRSNQTAALAFYGTVGTAVPITNVLTGINDAIYAYFTAKFDKEIKIYSEQTIILNSVGLTVLGILSGLFWIFLLKQLRECNNDLKKVLKNFPLGLVLNNSRLRAFMFKTSGNTLNSLKDKV